MLYSDGAYIVASHEMDNHSFIRHGLLRKKRNITLVNKTNEDEDQTPNILNVMNFHIKIIPFNLEIIYIR